MLIPLGIWAASGASVSTGAYELISTTILAATASTVTFNSLPTGYKHLQIRTTSKSDYNSAGYQGARQILFNGDYTSNWSSHRIWGTGSSVLSESFGLSGATGGYGFGIANSGTNIFDASVIDILDYTNTNKNKTLRSLSGFTNTASADYRISLTSAAWRSTSAVSSITMTMNDGSNYQIGSRFSLYGIKG